MEEARECPSRLKWSVIRTEPRAEYLAAAELDRQGLEIFFPRVKTARLLSGRHEAPLFPGYLFLRHIQEGEGRPSISQAPHVAGWVHFDGVIPTIPDEVVADLARRVEAVNGEGGLWRRFKAGEIVRVMSGNLESLAEVIEETRSPQSRVKVLLQFMGRLVPAQVPRENLQSVENGPVDDVPLDNEPREALKRPRRTRGRGRWIRGFEAHPVGSS